MPYRHLTDTIFEDRIGPGGLAQADFAPLLEAALAALKDLRSDLDGGNLPALSVAGQSDDLAALTRKADDLRGRCARLLVIGTGGSSLGAQAATALGADAGAIEFLANLDPRRVAQLAQSEDLSRAGLLIVSKSGATAEVQAQALILVPALIEAVGAEAARRQVCAIIEPRDSPLRRLADHWGLDVLDHDPGIGGRFSVLSLVGVLPLLFIGADARALREGAGAVLQGALGETSGPPPPAAGAALMVGLNRTRAVGTSVLMPYDGRLAPFARWYRQLWAESLGKGGQGMTPVAALGPLDQHSQLQLWLAGPADKVFSLILVGDAAAEPRIDLGAAGDALSSDLGYLGGKTMGDVVAAMARATADTLVGKGRPVRQFMLDRLDEYALGGLFMHFMLETILAGRLLGVDPFGQPAVEEGKELARRYLRES